MAIVRKCDRCGEYFDKPGILKPLYKVKLIGVGFISEHVVLYERDLCPKCMNALKEWLKLEDLCHIQS